MFNLNLKNLFVSDKRFYGTVFRLVLPLVLLNAMSLVLHFCDVFMLGRMGAASETAISAAQIANRPFFLFAMLMFGSMSGATVLCSQYWGKKDIATINSIAGVTLIFLLPLCAVFMSVCFFFAEPLMALLSNDPDIVKTAVIYLRIIVFSFVFNLLTGLFSGILRSVEKVKVPFIAALTGIIINIALNAILIYGFLGFPAMGIRGAAIGTVIARIIELAVILVYIIFYEKTIRFTIKKMLAVKSVIVKDFFKYGMPVIANEFIWAFGVTVHMYIIGNMDPGINGGDQIAAYTISNLIEQIAFMSIIGFSTVCCIVIGKAIGEGGDNETVAKYARTFVGLAGFFAFITAGAAFIFKDAIIALFEISGATKIYASQLFTVVTAFILLKTFNCVSIVGIFRGGGDTKFGMVIDSCFMYFISIPLGFLAAYYFKLSVPFVYAFLVCDELFKFPVVLRRVKSRRWIRSITREMG